MSTGNNGAAQAMFRSMRDGTCWLFVILSDHGWAITRDGQTVVVGTNYPASIRSGVQKYLSWTAQADGVRRGEVASRREFHASDVARDN